MLTRIKNYWKNLPGENKHTMVMQVVLLATLVTMTLLANIIALK